MNQELPEDLLKSFVHVDFKRFTDTDYRGDEQSEGKSENGYIIYNEYRKDFGTGSFWSSDDYTISADVMDFIEQRHPAFLKYIDDREGFFIEGTWHIIGDGKLS